MKNTQTPTPVAVGTRVAFVAPRSGADYLGYCSAEKPIPNETLGVIIKPSSWNPNDAHILFDGYPLKEGFNGYCHPDNWKRAAAETPPAERTTTGFGERTVVYEQTAELGELWQFTYRGEERVIHIRNIYDDGDIGGHCILRGEYRRFKRSLVEDAVYLSTLEII